MGDFSEGDGAPSVASLCQCFNAVIARSFYMLSNFQVANLFIMKPHPTLKAPPEFLIGH